MALSIENRARLAFALVITLLALAGLGWYLYSAKHTTTYQLLTHDSVSGLLVDAPVELHGVDVGTVSQIKLLDPHTVSILLSIDKEIPITTTTIATITSRGLATKGFTGYVYIAMEESGHGAPLSTVAGQSYPVLQAAPSRSFNLDTTIKEVNANVQNLTELLHTVLDKNTITALKESVESLQQLTRMLSENTRRLNTIIANTERASGQLKPLLDSSTATVNTLQVQLLPETYRTIDKLNRLSDSLNNVADTLARNPSVLLRGSAAPPPGPGENK